MHRFRNGSENADFEFAGCRLRLGEVDGGVDSAPGIATVEKAPVVNYRANSPVKLLLGHELLAEQ